jgi:hypothetical protein
MKRSSPKGASVRASTDWDLHDGCAVQRPEGTSVRRRDEVEEFRSHTVAI